MATYNRLESLIEKPSQNESSVMQSIPINVVVSSFEEVVEDSNENMTNVSNVLSQLVDRIDLITKPNDVPDANMPKEMADLLKANPSAGKEGGKDRNEKEQEKKKQDDKDKLLQKDREDEQKERKKNDVSREETRVFQTKMENHLANAAMVGTAILVAIPQIYQAFENIRGKLFPVADTLVDTVKIGLDPSKPNNIATRITDFLNVKVSEIGNRLSQSNNPLLSGLGGALYNATGGEMRDTTGEIQQLKFLKDEVQKYYQSGNKDVSLNLLQQYQNREEGNLLGTEPMRLLALQKNAQVMYEAINEASLPSEVIKSQANAAINLRNQGNDEGYKNMRRNLIKEVKKDRKNITDDQAEQAVDMLLSGSWIDFENMYEVSKESYDRGDIGGVISAWDVFAEKSGDNKRMPKVMRNLLGKEGRYAEDFTYDYMIANKLMTPDDYVRYMNQYLQSVVNDKYFEPYEEVNRRLEEAGVFEMSAAEYNRMKHQQEDEEWSENWMKENGHSLIKGQLRRGNVSQTEWDNVDEETKRLLISAGYQPYIDQIPENFRSKLTEAAERQNAAIKEGVKDVANIFVNTEEVGKYSPTAQKILEGEYTGATVVEFVLNTAQQKMAEKEVQPVMVTNNISQVAPPVGSATTAR